VRPSIKDSIRASARKKKRRLRQEEVEFCDHIAMPGFEQEALDLIDE